MTITTTKRLEDTILGGYIVVKAPKLSHEEIVEKYAGRKLLFFLGAGDL